MKPCKDAHGNCEMPPVEGSATQPTGGGESRICESRHQAGGAGRPRAKYTLNPKHAAARRSRDASLAPPPGWQLRPCRVLTALVCFRECSSAARAAHSRG